MTSRTTRMHALRSAVPGSENAGLLSKENLSGSTNALPLAGKRATALVASKVLAAQGGAVAPAQPKRALGDITNSFAAPAAGKAADAKARPTRRVAKARPVMRRAATVALDGMMEEEGVLSRSTSDGTTATTLDVESIDSMINLHALQQLSITDIDSKNKDDPLMCSAYAAEIYRNHKNRERQFLPRAAYMDQQTDITHKMRTVLIDWLVDVNQKFKLSDETFLLTINIVDRFLSQRAVMRNKLQLVGVTSMLIASKYQEIYAPEIGDFCYIADRAYTRDELLKMEATILNTLNFDVTLPSSLTFASRYLAAANLSAHPTATPFATYLLFLASQSYSCVGWAPSEVAAAAVYVTMKSVGGAGGEATGGRGWGEVMEFHSGYGEGETRRGAEVLAGLAEAERGSGQRLSAVRRMFSGPARLEVTRTLAVVE